jgi:hypothetical protein
MSAWPSMSDRHLCSVCGKALEGHLVKYGDALRPVRCNMGHCPPCYEFDASEILNLRSALGMATSDTMRMRIKTAIADGRARKALADEG